ncbi:hypothetical protein KAR91_39235 [Candidatus Pacearchaeota archaeon]|nr:hypothetical protein [Candidatus Pacearchaeota archaeon]
MKSLIALFTITSAFFLMSCSNVDQDLSPVGPEIEKISVPDVIGTYQYLTCFNSIPVDGFTVDPGRGVIEVVVGSRGWADNLEHIYVMLEYFSEINPSPDKMVYLEKPISTTFALTGFETTGLKDVKIYGYVPATDPGVQNPYQPQQSFNDVEIQWKADHNGIGLTLLDIGIIIGLEDSFVEITTTEGSFVTFIDVPTNQKIFIPYNGDSAITSVNLYCMQD